MIKNIAKNLFFFLFLFTTCTYGMEKTNDSEINNILEFFHLNELSMLESFDSEKTAVENNIQIFKDEHKNYTSDQLKVMHNLCIELFHPIDIDMNLIGDKIYNETISDRITDDIIFLDAVYDGYIKLQENKRGEFSKDFKATIERLSPKYKSSKRRMDFRSLVEGYKKYYFYDKEYILNNISINLLWCNREIDYSNTYIFPTIWTRNEEDINILERVMDWAKSYPIVNIWFDSVSVTSKQVDDTRLELSKRINELYKDKRPEIILKDIRKDLKIVIEHPQTFDKSNLYFHVDLSRVVASYETLINSRDIIFFLYADFSLNPSLYSREKLLEDPEIITYLNTYGMIQGRRRLAGKYENSFHIWSNIKLNLMKAIKVAIIDVNIDRKKNASLYWPSNYSENLDQVVYNSYPLMMTVFYDLENLIHYSVPVCKQQNMKEALAGVK